MEDSMKKMDYAIGIRAGRAGQKWTASALTNRAKERTPEPLVFTARPDALKFLKESQAEGYRFSGADLVDREQRSVKNRYFVISDDGQFILSGDDNGPRDTVWEIGDVMPGYDSNARTELVIENILQGAGVRERFGCDLAFILRPHIVRGNLAMQSMSPFDPAKPCPCGLHGKTYGDCCENKGVHALGNEILRGTSPRTVPGALTPIQSSMVNDDTRIRIVWNGIWNSPQDQTFHQFLDALVLKTLGEDWFEAQLLLPLKKQSEIVKWRKAMLDLLRRPGDADDDVSTGHTLTGPTKAYLCFGYDLYWLQLVHKLPEKLINRLKDFHKFQGARYEILIAAVFTRAGFDVDWIDDDKAPGKHPEFIATHKRTGQKIAVEAKSRRRSGSINFPGPLTPLAQLRGDDILPLYGEAIPKAPDGEIPFLIFIDPNFDDSPPKGLPLYSRIPIETTPWMQKIRDSLVEIWNAATEPTPDSAVVITNFAFYYGDNDSPSPAAMEAFFPSPKPRVPVPNDPMMADLAYCFQTYDTVPRQI
jgi:hypothetical protein